LRLGRRRRRRWTPASTGALTVGEKDKKGRVRWCCCRFTTLVGADTQDLSLARSLGTRQYAVSLALVVAMVVPVLLLLTGSSEAAAMAT